MKTEPKPKPASALPFPTVSEELTFLRKTFRDLLTAYSAHLEGEIATIQAAVSQAAESKRKLPGNRGSDVRDLLMLLRALDVKPGKGRRRDLKKVETLVEDLRAIVERW